MKVLITGFEPFNHDVINPSYEAVKLLPDRIGEIEIIKAEIPVVYDLCGEVLMEKIKEVQPDAVLCVGQAAKRAKITPEYIGINLKNSRTADNAGTVASEERIAPDGPDGYFSTLPVVEMVRAMNDAGIPAAVSYSAGTFCCNNILYALLHWIHTSRSNIKGGFVHVPYLPEQAARHPDPSMPSMPLETMAKGLELCIRTIGDSLK